MRKIYEELETRSLTSKSFFELKEYLNRIKFEFIDNNDLQESQLTQWEIDTFLFNINKNKLSGCFFGTDEKGLQTEYPTLKIYSNEVFIYLNERLNSCKSPFLKTRYAHFLWLSPAKNISHARIAVDSYLECISKIEELDKSLPDKYYGLNLIDTLINVFALASSINYKIEDVKSEVKRIVKTYSFKSRSSYIIRIDLTKIMLENKKFFNTNDFIGIALILEKLAVIKFTDDKEQAIRLLNLIVNIKKRINQNYERFERKIGHLWYLKSKENEQLQIESCKFLENAISQYKKLKDKKKVTFLQKRYNSLKKDINLIQFNEEIDVTGFHKNFQQIASQISSKSTEAIIDILMNDDSLLPKYEKIEQQVESEKGKFLFKEFFSNSVLDSKGNTVQHFDDEVEKKYFEILQSYSFHIQIYNLPLLQHIFYECAKKQKLNANFILKYLYANSWFGTELELSTTSQNRQRYNWLSLISPSLNEFFINLEFYFINPSVFPNFILCIDSLSTKIEGIIRDICEFKGITPFEFKVDFKGRNISFQKDIHKLLNEKEIANLISNDDLLLLKFVLIEKVGFNLRHKVAHSLMTYNEYNIGQMFLLIICVLKLGKYNFVKN